MYNSNDCGYSCTPSTSMYSAIQGYSSGISGGYSSGASSYTSQSSSNNSDMYSSQQSVQDFSPSFFVDDSVESIETLPEQETIVEHAKTTFQELTGQEFPENISVSICDDTEFKKFLFSSGAKSSSGVLGFALNRKGRGRSHVFVRKMSLPQIFVTLGHEIGHVITNQLSDVRDEEAKAFSFARAWTEKVKELNIAGLDKFLRPQPALNGVHNVAFDFVERQVEEGKQSLQLYIDIAKGDLKVEYLERIVVGG